MINLLLPFLSLALLLKRNFERKQSLFCPSSIVFGIYTLSFSVSFLYVYVLGFTDILKFENLFPAFFLASSLVIFFWNFYRFNEVRIEYIVLPGKNFLNPMIAIVIAMSLVSTVYFVPIAIKGFLLNNIFEVRNEIRNEGVNPLIQESILNTFASSAAMFYQLPILLFFISIVMEYKKIISFLLFISSLSYVFYVFAYLGRDGILFWMFSFIGVYSFFYKFLPKSSRSAIFKVFLVFSLIGLAGFAIITVSRFGSTDNYKHGIGGGIIDYLGQTVSHFAEIYNTKFTHMNGGYSFAYYRSLLGFDDVQYEVFQSELASQNVPSWVWGTFVRSFYIDFGVVGVIILAVLFNVLFNKANKVNNSKDYIKFSSLIIYFLFYQIFSQGVFYFRQYSKGMNLNMLLTVLLAVIIYYIINSGENNIVLDKNFEEEEQDI